MSCIDTGGAPPCTGTYAGYRRIISVGSLPALAPTRPTASFGGCARVMISGAGNINLRIGAPTGASLSMTQHVNHFGVLPTDTYSKPAPVPASQLVVWVNSDGSGSSLPCWSSPSSCAVAIRTTSGGATIIASNGLAQIDTDNAVMNGVAMAKQLVLAGNGTFRSDTSGLSSFVTTYSNFNNLGSWKDQ